jgi:uncharacterized protein YraI
VATVARSYVTSAAVKARSGPKSSAKGVRNLAAGAAVSVACQTAGSEVGTSGVWDKLTDGSYVPDHYVRTGYAGYAPGVPRCRYPYQVTASDVLNARTGPGSGYPVRDTLARGALAWVTCQRSGSVSGTTSVWNRLDTGLYVTDRYIATPSSTGFSTPIPRC